MPCWEVNTVTLEFTAKNKDLIMKVLKEMNLHPNYSSRSNVIRTDIGTFDLNNKTVETRDYNRSEVNKFRVKYSEAVVSTAAKKFGWKIKTGKRAKGKQTFVATKW